MAHERRLLQDLAGKLAGHCGEITPNAPRISATRNNPTISNRPVADNVISLWAVRLRNASCGLKAISSDRNPIYPATISTNGEGMFVRKLARAVGMLSLPVLAGLP